MSYCRDRDEHYSSLHEAHRLPLLLELLKVLGEVDANVHHHVLSYQLPLPSVVVNLIQDVQKRLVAGQPIIWEDDREKEW